VEASQVKTLLGNKSSTEVTFAAARLPGHVTVENIACEPFSRDPPIVQVLADVGFIERLGYGIDRMLQEAGQREPRFEETAAGFQVTLYAKEPRPTVQRSCGARLNLNPRG